LFRVMQDLLLFSVLAFLVRCSSFQPYSQRGKINRPRRNISCFHPREPGRTANNFKCTTENSDINKTEGDNEELIRQKATKRKMSWPFDQFDAPDVLDGTLAGDAGFDPLGIAQDRDTLFVLREAEVKHARLAMLAALGWPISELFHYQLATDIGFEDILADGGKAPSVLNGGLDNEFVLFSLGVFFAVGGVLEFELMRRRRETPEILQNFYNMWREDGWDTPGNYGFDPLKFGDRFCKDEQAKLIMQTVEIFNGRTAMLATVGFVVQEVVTGLPVVRETPQFFQSIW